MNTRKISRTLFAWISLALPLLPIGFFIALVGGGGSSGFGGWNDLVALLILVIGSALVGIVLCVIANRRNENKWVSNIALTIHLIFLSIILFLLSYQ